MTKFALIVAATEELGIGLLGNLPWRIPKDMAFFKQATTYVPKVSQNSNVRNAVIMGRVTWESIPPKFRPLDNRTNIVISRNLDYDLQLAAEQLGTTVVNSFEKAIALAGSIQHGRVFVIGGAQMYNMAINNVDCTHILLTRVKSKVDCDTFFPTIENESYRLASHKELEEYVESDVAEGIQKYKELEYEFTLYVRK